jgi:hypothetical protein
MPPLWTHTKVPPYRDWSSVGVGVSEAVGVEVVVVVEVGEVVGVEVLVVVDVGVGVGAGSPQPITNPTKRMTIRVKNTIFFIYFSLLEKLVYYPVVPFSQTSFR